MDCNVGVCYLWWCFELGSRYCLWNWFYDSDYEVRHKYWYKRKDEIDETSEIDRENTKIKIERCETCFCNI